MTVMLLDHRSSLFHYKSLVKLYWSVLSACLFPHFLKSKLLLMQNRFGSAQVPGRVAAATTFCKHSSWIGSGLCPSDNMSFKRPHHSSRRWWDKSAQGIKGVLHTWARRSFLHSGPTQPNQTPWPLTAPGRSAATKTMINSCNKWVRSSSSDSRQARGLIHWGVSYLKNQMHCANAQSDSMQVQWTLESQQTCLVFYQNIVKVIKYNKVRCHPHGV